MAKLKVAVIGCGGIANGKHMPALSKLDSIEMTAFCDIIIERAEEAAKKYGVVGAASYKDYKELLQKAKPDVVHVCTPNRSHSEITVAALESGAHVMCEKPMAINPAEAQKMLDAARRTGRKLTIGYQSRYRNDSMFLKRMCDNNELGDIYFAKAHAIRRRAVPTWGVFLNEYEQGGGPLIDIGTHALDLTLYMMNNYKPKMVLGTTYHKLNKQTESGNAWGDWKPEEFTVEDSAFGMVVMENGATISLESSWALNTLDVLEASTTLCGTLAGADMRGGLRVNGVKYGRQYVFNPDFNSGSVAFYEGASGGKPEEIEAAQWINAILTDTQPCVLPEQAFCVTQILDGIYQSSKNGDVFKF